METIITKIIICSGVLLGLYYLFLAKEKTLIFNRFYLIFSLIFSVAIPFFTIQAPEIKQEKAPIIFEEAPVEAVLVSQETSIQSVGYSQILLFLYGIITAIFLVKLIVSFIKIKKIKGRKMVYKSRSLVLVEKNVAPFSFWKTIYISEKSFAEGKIDDQIFLHEEIHIRQKHSLDLLLAEVVKAIFWFNPFVYLYKNAIVSNHEFLADEEVITKNKNIKNYQELVLKEVLKQQNLSLTHQFNFKNTKKRFIMMTKQNSKFAKAKRFLAIPVFVIAALAFAEKVYGNENSKSVISNSDKITSLITSENPLSEYLEMSKKYEDIIKTKNFERFDKEVPTSEKKKFLDLFEQIELKDRNKLPFWIHYDEILKKIPTQKQMSQFQNSKYNITINKKTVNYLELKNYKNTDFYSVFVIKNNPGHEDYGKYDYSVILYTNDFAKKYNSEKRFLVSFTVNNENTKPAILDTIVPKKTVEAKISTKNNSVEKTKSVTDVAIATPQADNTEKTPVEFPDGIDNFRRSVGENFNHARFEKKSGTISTSIMISIDENGNTTNITATGDDPAFNEEAVRTVKFVTNNKTWKPATENGKPVKSVFKLPLKIMFANQAPTKTQ